MPRERIHHGNPAPKGRTGHEEPSLDISWNRDGEWVQVSIEASPVWWEQWGADATGSAPLSVHTGKLTRQQINHMIRTLRRARDAAYGTDE